jgi:group I intron endonuclease
MIEGIIYCAISPSNKKYYGYTIDFEKRKKDHHSAVNFGIHNKFYNAIRKYGWESFKWEIIEKYETITKEELKNILFEREKYWISKEKTQKIGYNITSGGGGILGLHHTEKTKEKIRTKNSGITHPNFGKLRSQETIEKNRQSNLGKKRSEETKKRIGFSSLGKKHVLKETECPHCKIMGSGPNMSRYHFDNCRLKISK